MTNPNSFQTRFPAILWSIACLAVIGSIISGLSVTGGPQQERMRRMDDSRAQDLSQIRYTINSYYQQHHQLPEAIQGLNLTREQLYDPATHKLYGYRKIDNTRYELCARFDLDTNQQTQADYPQSYRYESSNGELGRHPKGKYCFKMVKSTQDSSVGHALTFEPEE